MTVFAVGEEQVTPDQLKAFDNDALKLVAEYHLAGWRSHMTNQGHVFLKAPDGSETASVTRDSLRGRSGRNAAAPLKRWRRRLAAEVEAKETARRKAAGASFGVADKQMREDDYGHDIPPRVRTAIQDHPDVKTYLAENGKRKVFYAEAKEILYVGVDLGADRPWERWTFVDRSINTLIAHGPGYTRAEALRELRAEGHLRPATEEELMAEAEGTTCPECGFEAKNAGSLNMHIKIKHTGFICPECGKNTGHAGRSLAAHRQDEHGITPAFAEKKMAQAKRANTCPECGEGFLTPQSLGQHRRNAHDRDVTGEVLALAESLGRPLHRTDLVEHLSLGLHTATSTLVRLAKKGLLARTERGLYTLPSDEHPAAQPDDDLTVTSPDVTPERDSEIEDDAGYDEDVLGTSLDVMPGPDVENVVQVLGALPDGNTAVEMIAQIRAVVTPPLMAQLREVTADRDRLAHENTLLTKQVEEQQARLDLLKEALGA